MKRSLICIVALGLAIAGPNPVSLCAVASSLATDCASAKTQPQCDQMEMGTKTSLTVTAGTASCCAISQAPMPEAKSAHSTPAPQQGPKSITVLATAEAMNHGNDRIVDVPQDASPPPPQSLLCTFLI